MYALGTQPCGGNFGFHARVKFGHNFAFTCPFRQFVKVKVVEYVGWMHGHKIVLWLQRRSYNRQE